MDEENTLNANYGSVNDSEKCDDYESVKEEDALIIQTKCASVNEEGTLNINKNPVDEEEIALNTIDKEKEEEKGDEVALPIEKPNEAAHQLNDEVIPISDDEASLPPVDDKKEESQHVEPVNSSTIILRNPAARATVKAKRMFDTNSIFYYVC